MLRTKSLKTIGLIIAISSLSCNTLKPGASKKDNTFTIVVMPDTQYYLSEQYGGKLGMFTAQIDWIIANRQKEHIAYVAGLGDISDHGDAAAEEWARAKEGYYRLEAAGTAIPYGLAVGNHDQTPNIGYSLSTGKQSCTTGKYNEFFGREHFKGKPYYGGAYTKAGYTLDNDCHYDLFSAGGVDFIVVYIEYDSHEQNTAGMNQWAYELLNRYTKRKAIIVTHYMADLDPKTGKAKFGPQAAGIYEKLKSCKNVFMFLGGHVTPGEAYREDAYQGRTIKTYIADYQSNRDTDGAPNGGDGYLRLMKFNVTADQVEVKTYSPYLETQGKSPWLTAATSQFITGLFGSKTNSD